MDFGHSKKLLRPTPRLSVTYIDTEPFNALTTLIASNSNVDIGIPPPPIQETLFSFYR